MLTPGGTTLLTAEAAGPAVQGVLENAFGSLAEKRGQTLAVQDLRALADGDSRGLTAFFMQVWILVPSLLAGAAVALAGRRAPLRVRLGVTAGYAVAVGLVAAAVADPLFDALTGSFWPLAGLAMLFAAAVALATQGLVTALGVVGAPLAFLVLVPLGVPVSGAVLGADFLPDGYRELSAWFPSGPAMDAFRNVAYFDANALISPALTLTAWALAGLLVIVAASWLRARHSRAQVGMSPAGGAAARENDLPERSRAA